MLKLFRHAFAAMGSPCEIQIYADTGGHHARKVIDTVLHDLNRLEARYSRYRSDSFLSQINQVAKIGGNIEVDPETASLLNYAETCFVQSEGLFDITSGLLRKVWRFDIALLPDDREIQQLLNCVGWNKLHWKAPVLSFLQPGMELDFGGIVKEYAADRAAALCLEAGIRHGSINLGGDIKIIGPHPDGSPWKVGIRHPRRKGGLLDSWLLHQGGLTSSGDYERCIVVEGRRYGHVLNPKTGWPVKHLASVSVAADFCVVAGSASTIAMLKEADGPAWLESLGLRHLWVDVDGNIGGTQFTAA
ncbi:FAD:protein FMN transferase [Methylomonas sp. MgM2]